MLGDAYECLIGQFASGSSKKAGEFLTPQQISTILSMIVTFDGQYPKTGLKPKLEKVFDFACGSVSLLLNIRYQLGKNGIGNIFGQGEKHHHLQLSPHEHAAKWGNGFGIRDFPRRLTAQGLARVVTVTVRT